jgi:hypothetical protein
VKRHNPPILKLIKDGKRSYQKARMVEEASKSRRNEDAPEVAETQAEPRNTSIEAESRRIDTEAQPAVTEPGAESVDTTAEMQPSTTGAEAHSAGSGAEVPPAARKTELQSATTEPKVQPTDSKGGADPAKTDSLRDAVAAERRRKTLRQDCVLVVGLLTIVLGLVDAMFDPFPARGFEFFLPGVVLVGIAVTGKVVGLKQLRGAY